MKLKTLTAICIIFAMGVGACSPRAAESNCPILPVGVLVASEDSVEGRMQRLGYEMAIQENAQNQSENICPLTLSYSEEGSGGNLDTSQNAIINLADQNVLAIVGGTSNVVSMQASAIMSNLDIPLLIPSLTAEEINKKENPWVFRMSTSLQAQADLTVELLNAELGDGGNVAILFEATSFGENAAVYAADALMNGGFKLVYYEKYQVGASNLTDQLEAVLDANAGVLYFVANSESPARTLLNALDNQPTSSLQVIATGNGFTSSGLLSNLGSLEQTAESVIIMASWNADLPFSKNATFLQNYSIFAQNHPDTLPPTPPLRFAEAYATMSYLTQKINLVLNDPTINWEDGTTLNDVAPLFRENLRQAIRIQSNQPESILGQIAFDAQGQNQIRGIVLQLNEGVLSTVFPESLATRPLRFERNW